MMNRRAFLASTAAVSAAAGLGLKPALAQGAWKPNRPVTLIVPWAAGGGTDATARIIGAIMEKEIGQPVNVVNRTGGSGVVGHSAISTAAPDGYTIGMITVEIAMMHWQGLTELTPKSYTPLALMNLDAAGLHVRNDAPYASAKDLVAAIKANPGKYKASGTGQGGIWHLAIAGMLQSLGVDPNAVPWVPSNGAAPGMQDLAAGGIEVVPCSVPEARSMIDAGKAKGLAIMADKRLEAFPNIPTLKEATGSDWQIGAWRGIAGPKGMPANIAGSYEAVLKKIYDSKEYKDFMGARGFGTVYADSKGFESFMDKGDADLGKVMKAVGIAKS
jgi:tripartite-type tricarboxylate transporter receptor subunit TctC